MQFTTMFIIHKQETECTAEAKRIMCMYYFSPNAGENFKLTTNSKKGFLNKVLYLTVRQVSQKTAFLFIVRHLKLLELLLGSSSLCHFEDVEPHGLAEGSALSNSHNVPNCDVSAEKQNSRQTLAGG